MQLHFGGANCIWYILIITNHEIWLELSAHNESNTLHYLATFCSMQFQIPLMHINVGYKPCLVKNLICTYMYVRFQRHQCILTYKNYSFCSFCAWNGVGNLKVIFLNNNGPSKCYSHHFQLDHVYFQRIKHFNL
jgi:hypothetical protein